MATYLNIIIIFFMGMSMSEYLEYDQYYTNITYESYQEFAAKNEFSYAYPEVRPQMEFSTNCQGSKPNRLLQRTSVLRGGGLSVKEDSVMTM